MSGNGPVVCFYLTLALKLIPTKNIQNLGLKHEKFCGEGVGLLGLECCGIHGVIFILLIDVMFWLVFALVLCDALRLNNLHISLDC